MPIKKGDLLEGRYLIDERIGSGGFSVVYRATDQQLHMTVAVKVFAPNQGLDREELEGFAKEYELMQRLDHHGLLRALAYFVHGESPCLVFPYMPHGNLFRKSRREGAFKEREIARVLRAVAGGLAYMHACRPPVLHNDVKQENILINHGEQYVLTDFGISREMRSTLMRASNLAGQTMAYISPEAVERKPIGSFSDVFALGVVLYELAVGSTDHPMPPGQVISFGQQLPSIDTEQYSGRLNRLVFACLSKDPANRPTAAALDEYARKYEQEGYWPEITEYVEPVAPPAPEPITDSGRQTVANTGSGGLAPSSDSLGAGLASNDVGNAPPKEKKKSRRGLLVALLCLAVLGAGGFYGYEYHVDSTYLAMVNQGQWLLSQKSYTSSYDELDRAVDYQPERQEAPDVMEELYETVGTEAAPELQQIDTLLADAAFDRAETRIEFLASTYGPTLSEDSLWPRREDLRFLPLEHRGDSAMTAEAFPLAIAAYEGALGVRSSTEVERKLEEARRREEAERLKEVNRKLTRAVSRSDEEGVRAALAEGAQADARINNAPATLTAIKNNSLPILKILIQGGANANNASGALEFSGSVTLGSPLVVAAGRNKLSMARYLIEEAGAGVNVQEYDRQTRRANGWTPVCAAAYYGNLEIVRYLQSKGANLDVSIGTRKQNPIVLAAESGHGDVVTFLAGKVNRIDQRNSRGETALHWAAVKSLTTAVKALVRAGASCTAKTSNGKIPYQFARGATKTFLRDCTPASMLQFSLDEDYAGSPKHYSEVNNTEITMLYRSGALRVKCSRSDKLNTSERLMTSVDVNGDWVFSSTLYLSNKSGSIQTGLVFGGEGNKRFYFALRNNDKWSLMKRDASYETLASGTMPSGTSDSRPVTMKVKRSGRYITCYLNGRQVARERVTSFFGNNFGVSVGGVCEGKFDDTNFSTTL